MELSPLGIAAIPLLLVALAATAVAVFVWRRKSATIGFDVDEAASYVWGHLSREQRQRISIVHVVAVLEAEKEAPKDVDDDELGMLIRSAAEAEGAVVGDDDVETILDLQCRYASEKGLM